MCRVSLSADSRPHEAIAFQVLATWFKRLKGLLGTSDDADPVALVRCGSIHTFAMSYPIDIAFVDEGGWILDAVRSLAPNRIVSNPDAFITLERPAAEDPWFEEGERLSMCCVTN